MVQGQEMEALRADAGEDGQITPVSTLEGPRNAGGSSGGSSDSGKGSSGSSGDSATKKMGGGGSGFFPKIVSSLGNRRKGAPHRAPLC